MKTILRLLIIFTRSLVIEAKSEIPKLAEIWKRNGRFLGKY